MGDWISVNKLVLKLPSPMSFLKSWSFLMRQISKSVAKSRAAFEESETSRFPKTWKSRPTIKCLVLSHEVVHYRSFLSYRSSSRW